MHPILTNRDRLALYLAAWVPVTTLLTAILARGSEMSWVEAVVVTAPMCWLYAFICLAAWYLTGTAPMRTGRALPMMGMLIASTLFSSFIWILAGRSWVATLEFLPAFQGLSQRYMDQVAVLFLSGVLLFLLAIAVHYLLMMLEQSRAAEKRALELQVLAREAELRALRAQIDPHFLFNSLNSISALTMPDPAAARRMCLLLADFMRTALLVGSKEQITFSEELRLAESFLEIEKVRFGARLSVEYRIDPDCGECLIPPLLIQPLVENAVRHGIAPLIEGGTISVQANRRGGLLEIVLENPYEDEASRSGTGLGMRNVRERLTNRFAGDARFEANRDNGRFRVALRIPCVRNGVH